MELPDLEFCTCAILPDRVTVEVVDWLQFLIQVDVSGQRYVCVVSGLEVGDTASRNAKAPQHCKQRQDGSERHLEKSSARAKSVWTWVNESDTCGYAGGRIARYGGNAVSEVFLAI